MQECVETLPVLDSGKVESKKIKMLSGPIEVDELENKQSSQFLWMQKKTSVNML